MEIFLKNWYLIVVGILLAIIVAGALYVRSLNVDKDLLRSENTQLSLKLEISNQSISDLQTALNSQNQAIDKLKADADARQSAAKSEIAKAKASASSAKRKAAALMAKKVPQGKTSCDAANDLINEEIKNANK